MGAEARAPGQGASTRAAAFLRLPCAAIERRPAGGAGDAGPRQHLDYPGLYAPRLSASRQGLRRGASARAEEIVRAATSSELKMPTGIFSDCYHAGLTAHHRLS